MTSSNRTDGAGVQIVMDGRPFAGGFNGYSSYLVSIIEPLLDYGVTITLISNRPFNTELHDVVNRCQTKVFGSSYQSVWEQLDVPRYLGSAKPDMYFVGSNRGLPWRKRRGTRYVLALLDVIPFIFPRDYLFNLRYIVRELRPVALLISVLRADSLVTISEQSAHDIGKFYHRSASPLLMRIKPSPAPNVRPKQQFSYVGGVDKRKRVGELIRAFAEFSQAHHDFQLMLIGRGYEVYRPLTDELGVSDRVIMPGFVDHDTKMKLIAESTALVYPSLYEGYGLAIAEGFMADVPVVAGRGGSQAEVGGPGVFYIDPLNIHEIALAMEAMLEPEAREVLAKGRAEQSAVIFGPEITTNIQRWFVDQATRGKRSHHA